MSSIKSEIASEPSAPRNDNVVPNGTAKSVVIASRASSAKQSQVPASTIRKYFDSIAVRYDFLNNFLSFKLDEIWRKRAMKRVIEPRQEAILDLGVGTGKFLDLFAHAKPWKRMVGLDFSTGMLQTARPQLSPKTQWVSADFQFLPFAEQTFDLVISAFTLRSVKNMPLFLKEIHQVLKPQGKTGLICLTRPRNFFWKILYYPYLKFYLPLIGGLFSGNKEAYRFLSSSIMSFQDPEKTAAMMKEAGFQEVSLHYFSFGMATLLIGKKQ